MSLKRYTLILSIVLENTEYIVLSLKHSLRDVISLPKNMSCLLVNSHDPRKACKNLQDYWRIPLTPFSWWLQIKFASVKLAKMYMKRVAMELQYMGPLNKDPALEYMLLQAVRFAFRMHQVTINVAFSSQPAKPYLIRNDPGQLYIYFHKFCFPRVLIRRKL